MLPISKRKCHFSSFQNIFFSRRSKPDTPEKVPTYLFEGAEWILLLRGINFLPTPFSVLQYTSDVSPASKIQTHCDLTNSRQGTGKEISSSALSRVAAQETAALPPPKKSIEFPFFFSRARAGEEILLFKDLSIRGIAKPK